MVLSRTCRRAWRVLLTRSTRGWGTYVVCACRRVNILLGTTGMVRRLTLRLGMMVRAATWTLVQVLTLFLLRSRVIRRFVRTSRVLLRTAKEWFRWCRGTGCCVLSARTRSGALCLCRVVNMRLWRAARIWVSIGRICCARRLRGLRWLGRLVTMTRCARRLLMIARILFLLGLCLRRCRVAWGCGRRRLVTWMRLRRFLVGYTWNIRLIRPAASPVLIRPARWSVALETVEPRSAWRIMLMATCTVTRLYFALFRLLDLCRMRWPSRCRGWVNRCSRW